jgi:hypothetical protein
MGCTLDKHLGEIMEQLQFATVAATCLTENCPNQNIDIEVKVVYPSGTILCGGCNTNIDFVMPETHD